MWQSSDPFYDGFCSRLNGSNLCLAFYPQKLDLGLLTYNLGKPAPATCSQNIVRLRGGPATLAVRDSKG